jgi:tetratricopeptide (TPR) repeat protein
MNYRPLFSTLSLTLLLQVPVVFLSSCSAPNFLQQNSSSYTNQFKPQDNLSGISKTIQDKAKQFTVRIDYPDGNGSGVIVAKNGKTYYVLTAKHVVKQDQEYKMVTLDEKEYTLDANKIKTLENADLAVLQFQSGETYQVATLADYTRELEEAMENSLFQLISKDPQIIHPWLFILGWQRVNNTPQLRLTAGQDSTTRLEFMGEGDRASLAFQSFDSLVISQSYKLSYTNFSQGGMSGGAVLDTLGRVIGIHAAAEGETSGLEEIQLGFSVGIPTEKVLSLISQAGIKPEWLKVEKARPLRITQADKQSITKNLLEIEPPGNNATEADWFNYGNDLWRIQRFQEASAAFDEAIKKKPDFHQAYYAKGIVITSQAHLRYLQELSEFSESLESPAFNQQFQQAVQSAQKAVTLNRQRRAKALPFFKKATEINPNFYPAWREIGDIKMTEQVTVIGPQQLEHIPLSTKATLAAKEALAAYDKATTLNPSDSQLYSSKGMVLQELSRHQEAIEAFTQAIKINPSPSLYSSRKDSYCAVGDKQKAEADNKSAEMLGAYFATTGCWH